MTKVTLKKVNPPKKDNEAKIYQLTDETMKFRKEKVLAAMEKSEIDTLVIYCDLEHGGNFSYLTGFVTRFEESLLVLHQTGEAFLVLGNENTKMVDYSRIEAWAIRKMWKSLLMVHRRRLKNIVKVPYLSTSRRLINSGSINMEP